MWANITLTTTSTTNDNSNSYMNTHCIQLTWLNKLNIQSFEKCIIRHTSEQKSFSDIEWRCFSKISLISLYLSSFFNPSQHSLPYNLWRPPNICHRSVAERCNRGKINLFHDLICPLLLYLLTLSMLSKLQSFVTGLPPIAATEARWIFSIISFVPSWPSVIFVTIVNVSTLPLFVTYLSPNIVLKARWIFSIISFLLSWPWVILVNIIDINNTGICHRYLSLNIALKARQNFLTISLDYYDRS